jgi:hypothetical protein
MVEEAQEAGTRFAWEESEKGRLEGALGREGKRGIQREEVRRGGWPS